MKTRKVLILALTAVMALSLLGGCGSEAEAGPSAAPAESAPAESSGAPETAPAADGAGASSNEKYGLDENLRFLETRKISVEVCDLNNDGGSDPTNNFYTDWLKEKVLERHNIEVEFIDVVRNSEDTDIATHLAAGTAPDVCYTYSLESVNTYGSMGGVIDMYPLLTELEAWLPNMYGLLGEANVFFHKDPADNHTWAMEGLLQNNWTTNTFVRKDWLDALGLAEPTTLQEFEDMLVAFKDNAATLLPSNPAGVIPFAASYDVRWNFRPLAEGFMPDDFTDKDRYINEFVEGWIAHPAAKQAVSVLNKWYNMDLMWKDFSLYNANTLGSVMDDLVKSGLVGALTGNVDTPFRYEENSYNSQLARTVGPEAMFVSVDPFPNPAGNHIRFARGTNSRTIFLPSTNDEPVASLLYIDFISDLEIRKFLQIGEEGVTHTLNEDGSITVLPATGEKIMNFPRNENYAFIINGLDLGDPALNALSNALGYPGTDPAVAAQSIMHMTQNARPNAAVNVGLIESEVGRQADLNERRDAMLVQSIVAPVDQFDTTYDTGLQDILDNGGSAIMEERQAKWEQFYGDAVNLD